MKDNKTTNTNPSTPFEITTLNKLKKGDYFKTVDKKGNASKTIYVKDDYSASERKFYVYKFSDICDSKLLKGATLVTTDFIF
jgi:hypothetical protein